MKLFQKPNGNWYASSKDQNGRTRYVSLSTNDREVAEEIAEEVMPQRLSHVREPIQRELERHFVLTSWTQEHPISSG